MFPVVQPLVCLFSPFKHIYPSDDNLLLQFPFPGCCEHENQPDLAHGYVDDTSQVRSCFNPMNKHSTFSLWDTCSLWILPVAIPCATAGPQGPAQGSLGTLTALCCTISSLNPNLTEPQWGKGNSTQLSPYPQNILCKSWVQNSLKAYDPVSHQIVLFQGTVYSHSIWGSSWWFAVVALQEELWGMSFLGNTNFHCDAICANGTQGGKLHVGKRNSKEIGRLNN